MSRITFVAGEIDGAIDVDRQIGIDLDEAAIVALKPVVAAPRLVRHVFDRERFVRRQRDVLQRARAAAVDGRFEDGVEFVFRNNEVFFVRVEAIGDRAFARQLAIELAREIFEIRFVVMRRDGVVDGLRLFVELHLLPLHDVDARDERFELARQIGAAQREHRIVKRHRHRRDLVVQRDGAGADLIE